MSLKKFLIGLLWLFSILFSIIWTYENPEKIEKIKSNFKKKQLSEVSLIEENSKNKLYSYLVNNVVPLHWFLLFTEEQKKVFKTHWGFGAIHYASTVKGGLEMIKDGDNLKPLLNDMENPTKQTFVKIFDELSITANWLSEFKTDSILILNYGDLLANLPPASLDKEDSVSILSDIKILIREKSFSDSEKLLNFLIERWLKIEFSNKKSESLSAN